MRITIFFGLTCIAEAVASQTGWKPTSGEISLGAGILGFAVVSDFIDFMKNVL